MSGTGGEVSGLFKVLGKNCKVLGEGYDITKVLLRGGGVSSMDNTRGGDVCDLDMQVEGGMTKASDDRLGEDSMERFRDFIEAPGENCKVLGEGYDKTKVLLRSGEVSSMDNPRGGDVRSLDIQGVGGMFRSMFEGTDAEERFSEYEVLGENSKVPGEMSSRPALCTCTKDTEEADKEWDEGGDGNHEFWSQEGQMKVTANTLKMIRTRENEKLLEVLTGGEEDRLIRSTQVPEDLLHAVEKPIVITGCDVEQLYPSMDKKQVAKLMEEAVMMSSVQWVDLDYLEGCRLIALNRSEDWSGRVNSAEYYLGGE